MKKNILYIITGLLFSSLLLASCGETNNETTVQKYNFLFIVDAPEGFMPSISRPVDGEYDSGTEIKVELSYSETANVVFKGFYSNGELVSNEKTYTFKLEKDTILIALFHEVAIEEPNPDQDNPGTGDEEEPNPDEGKDDPIVSIDPNPEKPADNLADDLLKLPDDKEVYSNDYIQEPKFNPIDADEYYSDINFNVESSILFDSLKDLVNDGFTAYEYGEARYILQYTDEYINGNGYLFGTYNGKMIEPKWDKGATWNREHLWPASRLPSGTHSNDKADEGSDLFNLRVSDSGINSSRSNDYYSEKGDGGYYPNVSGGQGDHRGDVARSIFYMGLKYADLGLKVVENPRYDKDNIFEMGKLSTLLKRNKEDPVSKWEMQRNERIYEYQGNRNPFVDYPDLADYLY